jgi:hypothetical protein
LVLPFLLLLLLLNIYNGGLPTLKDGLFFSQDSFFVIEEAMIAVMYVVGEKSGVITYNL